MTAFREVIVWIAIAFFVVSSAPSVIEENQIGVCYTNVSVNVSGTMSYIETYKATCWGSGCWGTLTRRVFRTTYKQQWVPKKICCEGYELKNETCESQCSSPCMNGYCTQPNTCTCDLGWSGDLCDKPLYCFVRANSTNSTSNPPATKNDHNVGKNSHSKPMLPACNSKCHEKFNSTKFNATLMIAGETRYLVPIDSPCQTIAEYSSSFPKIYINLIAGIIGIVLFIAIVSTLCLVLKKRKMKGKMTNKYADEPKKYVCADYIEENPIYS